MNGYGQDMMYGVPASTWYNWSAHTQELWLQDYYRTDAQATYYTMDTKSDAWKAAYTYTGITDAILGTDAAETGETVAELKEDLIETGKDLYEKTLDTGELLLGVAIVGGLILLSK